MVTPAGSLRSPTRIDSPIERPLISTSIVAGMADGVALMLIENITLIDDAVGVGDFLGLAHEREADVGAHDLVAADDLEVDVVTVLRTG